MDDTFDEQVDYKEMYFKMMRATTKAIDMLVTAQQVCEEAYVSAQKELPAEEN